MKRRYVVYVCLFFFLIVIFLLFSNSFFKVKERVEKVTSGFSSGDGSIYDVYSDENSLTFTDQDGNSIIYVFSDQGFLENVLSVFYCKNTEEKDVVYEYYMKLKENGDVIRVTTKDNIVSVVMNIDSFSEYKELQREEIEVLLFDNFSGMEDD